MQKYVNRCAVLVAASMAVSAMSAYGDVPTVVAVPLTFTVPGFGTVSGTRVSVLQFSADGTTLGGILRTGSSSSTNQGYIWTVGSSSNPTLLTDPNYNAQTAFDGISANGAYAVGGGDPPKGSGGADDNLVWNSSNSATVLQNLPGSTDLEPDAVSNDGSVVVGAYFGTATVPVIWNNVGGVYTPSVITNNGAQVVGNAYAVSPDGSTVYIQNGTTFTQWTAAGGIQPSTNQNASPLFAFGTSAGTFITPQLGTQNIIDYLVNQGLSVAQANEAGGASSAFAIIDNNTKVEFASNQSSLAYVVTMNLPDSLPTWNVNADGDWGTDSNWTTASPNAVGAYALLGNAIKSPRTVTLEADKTIASLMFDSDQSYTLNGPGTLNLHSALTPSIDDQDGSHTINAAITAVADLNVANSNDKPQFNVTVDNAGDTLALNGGLSTSLMLNKYGAGTLAFGNNTDFSTTNGLTVWQGTVQAGNISGTGGSEAPFNVILNGGVLYANQLRVQNVQLSTAVYLSSNGGVSRVGSISALEGASQAFNTPTSTDGTNIFDIANNAVVIDSDNGFGYTSVQAEVSIGKYEDMTGTIAYARNSGTGGLWTGDGLTSSFVRAHSGVYGIGGVFANNALGISGSQTATWHGQTVSATNFLVLATLIGDTNLDGVIDKTDYDNIDAGYFASNPNDTTTAHATSGGWFAGDFEYDMTVDLNDFEEMDDNYVSQPGDSLATLEATGDFDPNAPFYAQRLANLESLSVPEPGSLGLVGLCGLLAVRRRRFK